MPDESPMDAIEAAADRFATDYDLAADRDDATITIQGTAAEADWTATAALTRATHHPYEDGEEARRRGTELPTHETEAYAVTVRMTAAYEEDGIHTVDTATHTNVAPTADAVLDALEHAYDRLPKD